MSLIDRILCDHYDDMNLADHGLSRAWESVLLTPRFVTSRHVVALIFAAGTRHPRLVVKVPRRPGDNEGVLREARLLRELAACTGAAVGDVPEILGAFEIGRDTVLVETALVGAPLDPARVAADLDLAIRSGTTFLDALPVTEDAVHGWYERMVAEPLRALAQLVPHDAEVTELCERTHDVLAPLRSAALPAVFEHGDLSHPNILLHNGTKLQVMDWERASTAGLPGLDLVFYLQYLSESASSAYSRPQQLDAFVDAWGRHGWGRPILRSHLAGRRIDPDLMPLMIVASWARSAATLSYRLAPSETDMAEVDCGQLSSAVADDRDYWLWRHSLAAAEVHPMSPLSIR